MKLNVTASLYLVLSLLCLFAPSLSSPKPACFFLVPSPNSLYLLASFPNTSLLFETSLPCPLWYPPTLSSLQPPSGLPSSLQSVCTVPGVSAPSRPNPRPCYSYLPFTRHTGWCSVWAAPTPAPAHYRCGHQHVTLDCTLCRRHQPVRMSFSRSACGMSMYVCTYVASNVTMSGAPMCQAVCISVLGYILHTYVLYVAHFLLSVSVTVHRVFVSVL